MHDAEIQSFRLTAEQPPEAAVAALQADGVIGLRDAFDIGWRDTIETGITAALGGASRDVDVVRREGDTGRFSFSSGAWQAVEPFRRYIFESPLADIVLTMFGIDVSPAFICAMTPSSRSWRCWR